MAAQPRSDLSVILDELHPDDEDAQRRLSSVAYDELRSIAARYMRGERTSHSMQPTDLTNEAVARLLGEDFRAMTRCQFFAVAAKAMQRILIEHARAHNAQKRDPGRARVQLDDVADYITGQNLNVLALNEALDALAARSPRQSQVVNLRFFGGFTMEEIAAMLAVSLSTVEDDWRLARAWLHCELAETRS